MWWFATKGIEATVTLRLTDLRNSRPLWGRKCYWWVVEWVVYDTGFSFLIFISIVLTRKNTIEWPVSTFVTRISKSFCQYSFVTLSFENYVTGGPLMLDWFESSQLPAIGRSRKRKVLLMDIFSIPIFTSLLNSVFTDSLYSSVFTDSSADSLS